MGIQALPDTTVRAIGATHVLTDPAALVKELVDNALDAHANSISVEIHHNTLDIIQVRDNGHGIAPEDRPLVAKRYCTSKLLDYDDLQGIGGSSLGFRGEALASAAELSGSLTISTRIEGEQVGSALKINQKGEVVGQDRASLPVGTCVKITDFIKANPVRRQVTLKNADACLKKIKRCLQAYAFARPNVRYSLRVLKAKNTKGDWVYAPKLNGNIEDAAIKLIGSACASQCLWSVLEHEGFSFQAFLPRPDADASKIGGHGSFISVDARPVSSVRGHFKQIGKAFREALKSGRSHFDDVKEPFLHLEISCPKDSYDINVEPAKDDVAFEDAAKVIEGVKKLFAAVYTPRAEQVLHETPQSNEEVGNGVDDSIVDREVDRPEERLLNDDVNLAPTGFNHGEVDKEPSMLPDLREDQQTTPEPRRTFRSTMYGCDEDDLELLDAQPQVDRSAADMEELRQANKDVSVSNPWVLAKLNSSLRRHDTQQPSPRNDDSVQRTDVLGSPVRQSRRSLEVEEAALPTPRPSSPSPPAFHPSDHVPNMRLAKNGNLIGGSTLPAPQMYTPVHSSDPNVPEDPLLRRQHQSPAYNYGLSPQRPDAPAGMPLEAIPDISTRPSRSPRKQAPQSRVNKPFVPPMRDGPPREKVWFDHLENVESSPRPQPRPRQQNDNHGLVVQGELRDLVEDARPLTPPRRNRDIRDFVGARDGDAVASMIEARDYSRRSDRGDNEGQESRAAAEPAHHSTGDLRRHGFVRASDVADMNEELNFPEKPAANHFKRRKTSERQPLHDLSTNTPSVQAPEAAAQDNEQHRPTTTMSSRAPSRRRSSHKLGRTKSSKLPLERTPAGQATHNLILPMPVSIDGISKLAGKIDEERSLLGFNSPAVGFEDVFSADPPGLEGLARSLHGLLVREGEEVGVEGLLGEVKKAFETHSRAGDGDDSGGEDEAMSHI